ncbi:MAG: hypothetical protein GDA43_23465 [Hormoscilla sp. SP5CHS1]|nr:hypothetical protein [Hormoscilla sp. SP12CHS1]MBC6455774.1 hypothetical protein [Hormoscilla sp. SP5CHS1]
MTPLELREKGYQILVNNLGQVDAIRFLQQMGWGMVIIPKKEAKFWIM